MWPLLLTFAVGWLLSRQRSSAPLPMPAQLAIGTGRAVTIAPGAPYRAVAFSDVLLTDEQRIKAARRVAEGGPDITISNVSVGPFTLPDGTVKTRIVYDFTRKTPPEKPTVIGEPLGVVSGAKLHSLLRLDGLAIG